MRHYFFTATLLLASTFVSADEYWYFCKDNGLYYPYTATCPSLWQKVLPEAQPNISDYPKSSTAMAAPLTFEDSVAAYKRGDYSTAVEGFRVLAESGDAKSQIYFGYMYYYGQGVPQDYKQAEYWYAKAAAQGSVDGEFNLGNMYSDGRGVSQDYKQAQYWYLKAATQGNPNAQNNLGLMYYSGEGIAQDSNQAVLWLTKAAEQGVAQAQVNLGVMYGGGHGIPQDYQQAQYWYAKAAAQGNSQAQANLKWLEDNGPGSVEPPPGDEYWYICDTTKGGATYYPFVKKCSVAWRQIPAEEPLPPQPPKPTFPNGLSLYPDSAWNERLNEIIAEYQARNSQAKQEEEAKKAQEIAREKINSQRERDEKKGYKYISVSDFELDKKTIPGSQKLVIHGIFQSTGDVDWLVEYLNYGDGPKIALLTDEAPRDVRARLQSCRTVGICDITLIGHVSGCEHLFLGTAYKTDRCLSVDGIKN